MSASPRFDAASTTTVRSSICAGADAMQCVVLAGGLGTRMRPWTDTVPKILVPVLGVPFAAHQLELLARQGYDEVVVCLGHRGNQVRDFVGDGRRFGVRVSYVDEG